MSARTSRLTNHSCAMGKRWVAIGAPGRRQKKVGRRTIERYSDLLRCHVVPTLGERRLQELQATEIDALYLDLGAKLKPGTACYVHAVLNACLATAVRKGLIRSNPLVRVEKVPAAIEADHGVALDEDELRKLIEGFRVLRCSRSSPPPPSPAQGAAKSSLFSGSTSIRRTRHCGSNVPLRRQKVD